MKRCLVCDTLKKETWNIVQVLGFYVHLERLLGKKSSCLDKNQKIYDKFKVTSCANHFNMGIDFYFEVFFTHIIMLYIVKVCLFIFCAGQRKTYGWSKACINNARGTENIAPVPKELL